MISNKQDALEFLTKLITERQRKIEELKYQLIRLHLDKDIKPMTQITRYRKYLIEDLQMLQDSYKFISNQILKEVREWN